MTGKVIVPKAGISALTVAIPVPTRRSLSSRSQLAPLILIGTSFVFITRSSISNTASSVLNSFTRMSVTCTRGGSRCLPRLAQPERPRAETPIKTPSKIPVKSLMVSLSYTLNIKHYKQSKIDRQIVSNKNFNKKLFRNPFLYRKSGKTFE